MNTLALVEKGRLTLPSDGRLLTWLSRHEGEVLSIRMEAVEPRRTVAQNARQWAGYTRGLRLFSALSGHDKEDLHDAMKRRFLEPVRLYTDHGELIGSACSTKHLSIRASADYQDNVGALFAGWGADLWPTEWER